MFRKLRRVLGYGLGLTASAVLSPIYIIDRTLLKMLSDLQAIKSEFIGGGLKKRNIPKGIARILLLGFKWTFYLPFFVTGRVFKGIFQNARDGRAALEEKGIVKGAGTLFLELAKQMLVVHLASQFIKKIAKKLRKTDGEEASAFPEQSAVISHFRQSADSSRFHQFGSTRPRYTTLDFEASRKSPQSPEVIIGAPTGFDHIEGHNKNRGA